MFIHFLIAFCLSTSIALADPQPKTLNLDQFIGQRFLLPAQAPVSTLTLDLRLEKDHELLKEQSSIRIYDENKALITKAKILGGKTKIRLTTTNSKKLYIHTSVFFCRHTAQGLCIIKNAIFEVPINNETPKPLEIQYELPSEKYSLKLD